MSLPSRNGGLGIHNPAITSENNFEDSKTITKHIADLILKQEWMCPDESKTKEAKDKVVKQKREREKNHLRHLKEQITEPEKKKKDKNKQTPGPKEPTLSKALELAHQKGASSWLTALPLADNNFVLNKEEFRDALHFGMDGDQNTSHKSVPAEPPPLSLIVWTASLGDT